MDYPHGVSIEVWVLEMTRDTHEINDLEGGLALLGVEARPPADDLLELHHRADRSEDHDILEVRHIDTRRQKAGSGRHHWRRLVRVAKGFQQTLLLTLHADDADHPLRVVRHEIRVGVD